MTPKYTKGNDGLFHCTWHGCKFKHRLQRSAGRHYRVHTHKGYRGRRKKAKAQPSLELVVNNTNPTFKGPYEAKEYKDEQAIREEIIASYCAGYVAHFLRDTADSANIAARGLAQRVAKALLAL